MKNRFTISQGAAFVSASAVALAVSPSVETTVDAAVVRAVDIQYISETSPAFVEESDPVIYEAPVTNYQDQAHAWNEDTEDRFDALAEKFALEEISAEEQEELNRLQKLRRRETSARTYDEVRREYEIELATQKAIKAIDDLISSVRPISRSLKA